MGSASVGFDFLSAPHRFVPTLRICQALKCMHLACQGPHVKSLFFGLTLVNLFRRTWQRPSARACQHLTENSCKQRTRACLQTASCCLFGNTRPPGARRCGVGAFRARPLSPMMQLLRRPSSSQRRVCGSFAGRRGGAPPHCAGPNDHSGGSAPAVECRAAELQAPTVRNTVEPYFGPPPSCQVTSEGDFDALVASEKLLVMSCSAQECGS